MNGNETQDTNDFNETAGNGGTKIADLPPDLKAALQAALQPASTSEQQAQPNMLVEIAHGYMKAVSLGLIAANPQVPPQALWDAMIEGFGRVISEVTQSDNAQATLGIRTHVKGKFGDAVSKFVPAIKAANANVILPGGRA